MEYTFSLGWLFGGLAVAAAGTAIVVFYRQISENLASGVSSYDRVKLFGVITIIVGLLAASNLLPVVLTGIIKLLFQR